MKTPVPSVTATPEVDFVSSRLWYAASMNTVTVGGQEHPSVSGVSLVALRNAIILSSFMSSPRVGALTLLRNSQGQYDVGPGPVAQEQCGGHVLVVYLCMILTQECPLRSPVK